MRDPEGGRPNKPLLAVGLVIAVVMALAALGATSSWGPLVEVLPVPPEPVPTGPLPSPEPEPSASAQPDPVMPDIEPFFQVPDWVWELLRVLAAAAVAVVVVWFVVRVLRQLRGPELGRAADPAGSAVEIPEIDEQEVVESLDAAIASLRSGMAVDGAVVECWHRLERIAADSGIRRAQSQTAQEFTVEILGHAVVDDSALAELAALYRRAMFSNHVLSDVDRERAIACLQRLAAQLGAEVGGDG